jgi:integrase
MSVYKRGGVYWYDFWFQGQRYQQSTSLNNKTAALRAEAIRKAELAEGKAGIVRRKPCPTFQQFVEEEFLPWSKKEHERNWRTHKRYQVSAKPLKCFFGKSSLDAISSGQIEKFKMTRASEISNAGTNRDLAALRYMLNFAVRQEHISKNPVKGVKFLREGPGMMRVVSHDEQRRYFAVANPLLQDVATLIVETGMRPEEVFSIRKENVHLDRRYLFVPKGKTKFARRNVPLTDATIDVLKRRLAKLSGQYLFPCRGNLDAPLTTVRKHHCKALKDAKINPAFRLYDLRHTFGSRSAMAGVDLPTLKELMGHSQISITMRYVHPTPEHKIEAVNKLQRYNAEQLIAAYERAGESLQKSLQSQNQQVLN